MGSGIPLFSGVIQQAALELTNSKIYENGVVMLYYKVKEKNHAQPNNLAGANCEEI
jgi:hypothetical protein